MAFEELGKARYLKLKTPSGITIKIPSKKNCFIILFMGFWLLGWAVGEIAVLGVLTGGLFKILNNGIPNGLEGGIGAFGGLFLIAWLGGWTVGGAFAIYAWLWQVKGLEEVSISHDGLKIEKKVPVWARTKNYRLKDVVSLRVNTSQASMWTMSGGMEFWGLSGGQLAFDYGAKTVRFGIGVDEAEAKQILNDIQENTPQLSVYKG